jgi:diguanylate cyclase (GGDEF)-like protein/putative nucleotidyltransferase with HDIG domain
LADAFGVHRSKSTGIVDVSESHLLREMVKAGVWLTFGVCLAGMAYAGVTWDEPHRPLILGVFGVGFLGGIAIALLPLDRVLRSRFRDPFFVTWSLLDIGLIATAVAADGGAQSAFTLLFILPLVFAAIFYPLNLFVVVGAADVISFLIVADLYGDPEMEYVTFVAATLAFAAVLCAWQAQNHDRHRERLTHMSNTDPLTHCLNRRGFEERVTVELESALRTGRAVGLVLIDLDNFKAVNDHRGHAAGDALLCWVADSVKRTVRAMDTVGRLGGDEFAVLAPGLDGAGALSLAERIRHALADGTAVTTGVASFPVDGVDHDELQRRADAQLYELKHGLRGTVDGGRRELSWAASLARVVDLRMAVPSEHSAAVARHATGIAEQLGWSGAHLGHLRVAAMLHDVGKVSLPDRILQKPGPLTDDEYEVIKRHPVIGAEFVSRVDNLSLVARWVRHSHEHFDGSGYPDRLAGEEIPLASRILLVADAYDAMTTDRPYRDAMTQEEALDELRLNAGRQFDPRCVEAFEEYLSAESPSEAIARAS